GAAVLLAAAVLASHGLAFAALQLGFQRGGALATAGVASLLTNALPIAAGTTVFAEGLPAGARGAARILAFALVLAGALLLARATDAGAQAARRRPAQRAGPSGHERHKRRARSQNHARAAGGRRYNARPCRLTSPRGRRSLRPCACAGGVRPGPERRAASPPSARR